MLTEALSEVFGLSPFGDWNAAATPPPELTVSEWADRYRFLPKSSAANGARWRTSDVPYLRGIMDAVHEPTTRQIALMKCAQAAGTEGVTNIIGYHMHHDPCPMLLVQPAESVAQEYSKERLADMLRSTEALRALVGNKRHAESEESTLLYKWFPGGFLALGGANSPNTYARRAARIVIADDFDRFPATVGDEGDPSKLLAKRTETFDNGIEIYVSTPTLKNGRIDTLFQRGDQRRFFVQCPHCHRWDWMAWSDAAHFHVKYDNRDPETARIECPADALGGCGAHLDEAARRQMVRAGEWRSTATAKDPGLVSFHLPAMVTTIGSASLHRWVAAWLSARELGTESTRVFVNTTLGEGWEDHSVRMEPHTLMVRRGQGWPAGAEVPAFVSVLTCGIDVQVDRFELQVVGWGSAGQRAVVDYRVILGDPRSLDTQRQLLEVLERTYTHELGPELPVRTTCIDTGFYTDDIYEFVLGHPGRELYPVKGIGRRAGNPIVMKRTEQQSGKSRRKIWLYPVNTDDAKSDIIGSLSIVAPGPGYTYFPAHLDTVHEGYFAGLCSEQRVTKYNRAKVATHQEWEQIYQANEPLDTFAYALAAFRILNPNLHQMRQRILEKAAAMQPEPEPSVTETAPAPPAATQPRQGRRVARSKYLG